MTASTIGDLCRRVRVELAAFGELASPLLVALDTVADTAGERAVSALGDPSLVLELARRRWPTGHQPSAAVVGHVLDDLRHRSGVDSVTPSVVTVADAVAAHEAGVSRSLAAGSRASYGTWFKRLVTAYGDEDVATITEAQLTLLIADHVGARPRRVSSQDGRCAEEMAIAAYRHLWAWLADEGLVARNIAKGLRKPFRPEPLRRPIRADECALVRQLARVSSDPLLDELAIALAERLGLRPIEIERLSARDVDLADMHIAVIGKSDRRRRLPVPPRLGELLRRYVAERVGEKIDDRLLRHRDRTEVDRGWLDRLFPRLTAGIPALAAPGHLSLYSYRHAIASWIDPRYGRAVTRRLLGHAARWTVTDQYVHADEERLAEALREYESHLLAECSP